ncbi:hypothetical protein WJX73_002710 [Symbiochloris irregularis]|uniref:Uncharacterized protein n=1 Tax=Symbiochloris irregularis TaxID=706552 RepID=A0AAW1NS10_9CHLO
MDVSRADWRLLATVTAIAGATTLVLRFAGQSSCPLPVSGTLTFTGSGLVHNAPDAGKVTLTVTTKAKSASDARESGARIAAKVLSAIKELPSLMEKDIATEGIHVGPDEVWEENKMVHKGFLCTNTFTVEIQDLTDDKLAAVIDTAVAHGDDKLEISRTQVYLSTALRRKLTDDARRLALNDARKTASWYAQETGAKIGPIKQLIDKTVAHATAQDFDHPIAMAKMARATAATPTALGQQSTYESALNARLDKPPDPRRLPWAGNGTCEGPVYNSDTGLTEVHCLGPRHPLSPGQTIDVMMLLESPYPKNASVIVHRQTAQLVDDNLRPVPLTEVYVHHYVSSASFLLGNGAEIRGSFKRAVLPEPYALIVNGSAVADPRQRLTNIQLINTVGLPAEEAKPCLECWCNHTSFPDVMTMNALFAEHPHASKDRGDPTDDGDRPASRKGSLVCCHQCPSSAADAEPVGYHLQYNVSYRAIGAQEVVNRTDLIGFDVVNGSFEYQIPKALGPGSSHVQEFDTVYDKTCPQKAPVDIIRCTGHQHFGGKCIELWDLDKDALICRACPKFGTQPGSVGNEEGYVTSIPDDNIKPYTVDPGTRVRVKSMYDASVPRFGVMGLLSTWAAGLPEPCYRPPVNNSLSSEYSELWHTPQFNHMGFPLQQDVSVSVQ